MTVKLFSQRDPRWSNQLLGYNPEGSGYTIGAYGCLISSLSMLVATVTADDTWTPARMNTYLKSFDGFDPAGGLLRWYKVPALFPYLEYVATTTVKTELDDWVKTDAHYAICKVNAGAHYVLAAEPGEMADPEYGRLAGAFGSYTFNEARLYRVVGGKGSGAPEGQVYLDQPVYDDLVKWKKDGEDYFRLLNEEYAKTKELLAVLADTRAMNANAVPAQAAPTVPEYQRTYVKLLAPVSLRSVRAGVMKDFSGAKPDYQVPVGMVFPVAGRFSVEGAYYYVTQRSADNGDWYGAPVDLFDETLELEPATGAVSADSLHVGAATAFGLFKKAEASVTGLFKKGTNA